MKSKLTLLFLLLLNFNFCFAGEVEKLPEVPWRAIVETQNERQTSPLWKNNVTVKLFGNYSTADSAMVVNSIAVLDSLTERLEISMSSNERGNIEIYFFDSTNRVNYQQVFRFSTNYSNTWIYTHGDLITNGFYCLAIQIGKIPVEGRQNFLTNNLAFALYPNYWFDDLYFEKKRLNEKVNESIFRALDDTQRDKLYVADLQELDKKLLNAVYSTDFEIYLKIAQKQYGGLFPWWVKVNPYSFLLLPFLLLLLIFTVVYLKISYRIVQRVSNKLLRFNINGIIIGLFFAFIVSFYFSLSNILEYSMHNFSHLQENTIYGTAIIFIIGLLAINLLRLFEIIIHKNTKKKLFRIALIFLTTGMIPFSAFFAIFLYSTFFTNRPVEFREGEIKILSYVFIGCMVVALFRALISYFIFKEKDLIFESETKLSTLRELKTKAEMNALHSRINPHFLYNSLNSIAGLAHDDADKTEHMALSLSKLFRYSINKDQSDWTTLEEELEMVKIYLDVEKVRFDDRLNYTVELPKVLNDYKIPRFMIQPLVENAVKHGLSKSVESGEIKVSVTQEGRKVYIAVSDDGPAFPNDLAPGFGIQSIYDKLEILYKDKFEMNFINTPQKQVLIKLN